MKHKIIKQNCLIKEAIDFKAVIDHILKVRELTIEYLALGLDEPVSNLISLRKGETLLNRKKLIRLCHFYVEVCLVEQLNQIQ